MFDHLMVAGLGLMGGSVVKAACHFNIAKKVSGVDPNVGGLSKKVAQYVDVVCPLLSESSIKTVDCLVLAMPVEQIIKSIELLNGFSLPKHLILTDVGSVKQPMIDLASAQLKKHYVPAHPIAGSEQSGFEVSVYDLFVGHQVIIIPQLGHQDEQLKRVEIFWSAIGASILRMQAEQHDRIYSLTSHLPHLLAYAASLMLGKQSPHYLNHCGAGFKDFSRIAKSDPTMWTQIFSANPYFIKTLDKFIDCLGQLREKIDQNDQAALLDDLEFAQRIKKSIV